MTKAALTISIKAQEQIAFWLTTVVGHKERRSGVSSVSIGHWYSAIYKNLIKPMDSQSS